MTYTLANSCNKISHPGILINKFEREEPVYKQCSTVSTKKDESLLKKYKHIFSNKWKVTKTELTKRSKTDIINLIQKSNWSIGDCT
jgi:hypothetical protein